MELVHGTCKASKFAHEDFISSMPDNVITNILDRCSLKDAVRTGILSRNWRFKWTLLSQLMFDEEFFDEYLTGSGGGEKFFDRRNISRLLLHLKGVIRKFVLYTPSDYRILDVEDINHWIMFLSQRGIMDLTLINIHQIPLKLPTHLFSCVDLVHLKLYNCCFQPPSTFHGFPNLLSLELSLVRSQDYRFGELLAQCPLIENMRIADHEPSCKVKPIEIAKLENLKILSLSLCLLNNMTMITCSSVFQQLSLLPKLEELNLYFRACKFLAEAGAQMRVSTTFPCLKALTLDQIDFSSSAMLACSFAMVFGSPNLQTLDIIAIYNDQVRQPAVCSSEADCSTVGQLQLRNVVLTYIKGLKKEVHLIKCILACSPFLKKMVIQPNPSLFFGGDRRYKFASKLLKLHRASPTAEIDF